MMIIQIDFESDNPIYMQLREQLIEGIAKGEIEAGEVLPSVRQLAEDIGINLHTVNKTYNILKAEGYVTIDRRKGAVVNEIPHNDDENIQSEFKENFKLILSQMHCKGITKQQVDQWTKEIFKTFIVREEN